MATRVTRIERISFDVVRHIGLSIQVLLAASRVRNLHAGCFMLEFQARSRGRAQLRRRSGRVDEFVPVVERQAGLGSVWLLLSICYEYRTIHDRDSAGREGAMRIIGAIAPSTASR
jgi:hypothetical protein